jgi:hypothetical protein
MRINRQILAALPLLLIVTGLAQAPLSAAKREGAQVIVDLKEGERFSGELIAVRTDSLLILDGSGQDRTCELGAVARLTLGPRRHRAFKAALVGGLAGAVVGATIGVLKANGDHRATFVSAVVFAPLGGVVGAFTAGLIAGSRERTYVFEGMTDEQVEKALLKLKAAARMPSEG